MQAGMSIVKAVIIVSRVAFNTVGVRRQQFFQSALTRGVVLVMYAERDSCRDGYIGSR